MIWHSLSQLSTYQLCTVHGVDYGSYTPLLSDKMAYVTANFEKPVHNAIESSNLIGTVSIIYSYNKNQQP